MDRNNTKFHRPKCDSSSSPVIRNFEEVANLMSTTALSADQSASQDNCQCLVLEFGRTVIFVSCLMTVESLHLYISTLDIMVRKQIFLLVQNGNVSILTTEKIKL